MDNKIDNGPLDNVALAEAAAPVEKTPAVEKVHSSEMRFCSNFKKIVDKIDDATPKKVVQKIASLTKISNRMVMGFYTGKFVPNIKEALKVAAVLNANVEGIWYLMPPATPAVAPASPKTSAVKD